MKVLITGGAGFIGSHIVEHFQNKAEVRVLDNLRSGFKRNLAGFKHVFIETTILDRKAVRHAMNGIDFVFHLAAMISVPESMQKPIECNEINTTGTLVVLEEAARAKVKKLIFSSSAAVYGDNPATPKIETMLPEPKSPYAIAKLDGEHYCRMFACEGKLQTTCLRYFNVFGPRQDPQSPYAAVVPNFVGRAVKHEPITIFGDGEQARDFIYVKDVVAANAFFTIQSPAAGVFNVAHGRSITINELAKRVFQLIGWQPKIKHAPARLGDVKHSQASVEKLRAAGFAPAYNLDKGLKATIEYFALKQSKNKERRKGKAQGS
jgi:UDP-glucose 4-epimerase